MKKFLKVLFIFLGVILVLLIVTPIFFKKPIEKLVKEQINKTLDANVDFSDFNLSFLRGFPNIYIGLENFCIVGKGEFEKDTLLSFKTFSVKVDLISAIKMKNIKVKSVLLDYPRISAKVLKNGKANWNVMKESAEKTPADTTPSKPFDFSANLKKFEIIHAYIKYEDDTSRMSAEIKDFNFLLSGDFSAKTTEMKIKTSIKSIDFIMSGIKYLKQTKFGFAATLGADMEHSIYTIKDNEIQLNELSLSLDGILKMPKDAMDVDLKFKTNKADFKTLLSMVPAVYMKDFQSVQTVGTLKLNGFVKGIYAGKKMPNAGIILAVENAMFKYPSLPKSVNNINIDMALFFDGIQNDNSTVDINKFHFEMANNPFDINLHLKTPMSDMNMVGNFTGKIDFNTIADIVPMDSLTLKGIMESNIDIMGQMSSIQKGKYEEFKADGSLKLENFEFASPAFQQGMKILTANLQFSPKIVELTNFDSRIGKSDIKLSGKLEKFIPYVFSKDTIVGALNFTSNLLDINELMGPEKAPATTAKDTTQLSVVEVPGNINFALNSKIGQINYDKLKITDLAGVIIVRNSKAVLKNLGMNLLEGSMVMNGEYNTRDIKKPSFNFALGLKDIDIPSSYTAFNTIEKLAPVAQNCKGRVSADLTISSTLDQHMMPVYNTMAGNGRLTSKSIEMANSPTFIKIADALKNDKFRKLTLENVDIKFEIKDGRVYVNPFETKMGTSKMVVAGDQGIDQTLNYVIKTIIPRSEFGGAANSVLTNLTSSAAAKGLNINPGENVNIDISVLGTVLNPEVKLSLKDNAKNATKEIKEQLKATVTQKVEDVKQQASQKAKEQADKIIKDAEAEAQKIRDGAKTIADATKKEANALADKTESEAKNPLAKIAAKKAAEKIRKDGDAKANKILEEGNAKADGVINKAKEEAAKIK